MNVFLFQATVAPGQQQTTTTQTTAPAATVPLPEEAVKPKQSAWGSVGFMVLLFAVLYFLMIRPNQKKEKQRKEKLASLVEGDKVVTIGGIRGTVVSVREDAVVIKSKGTEMELVKGAIGQIIR